MKDNIRKAVTKMILSCQLLSTLDDRLAGLELDDLGKMVDMGIAYCKHLLGNPEGVENLLHIVICKGNRSLEDVLNYAESEPDKVKANAVLKELQKALVDFNDKVVKVLDLAPGSISMLSKMITEFGLLKFMVNDLV